MKKQYSAIAMAFCTLLLFCNSNSSGGNDSTAGGGSSPSTCAKVLLSGKSTCPLSLTGAVTTLAGSGSGDAEGTGNAAMFQNPAGVTTDGTNLYVADQSNNKIRKVVIATGVVTTLAGSGTADTTNGTGTAAAFNNPTGITTDGTNLYVAEVSNNRIRKIVIATGVVTTLAGFGPGDNNGTGTAATFNQPSGITTDGTNLYVADQVNNQIRKIVIATAVVTTLAGNGPGNADGTGTAATFWQPTDVTTDGTNLYVADNANYRIRKIVIATGVVTTLAGNGKGSADGTGTTATFSQPSGLTTDGTNLYVVDNDIHRIRKIVIATGVVTTLAGSGQGSADGTGTAATFFYPKGVTTDGTNLYVADQSNHRIRKIQ